MKKKNLHRYYAIKRRKEMSGYCSTLVSAALSLELVNYKNQELNLSEGLILLGIFCRQLGISGA
jgi:hypothetical protein